MIMKDNATLGRMISDVTRGFVGITNTTNVTLKARRRPMQPPSPRVTVVYKPVQRNRIELEIERLELLDRLRQITDELENKKEKV